MTSCPRRNELQSHMVCVLTWFWEHASLSLVAPGRDLLLTDLRQFRKLTMYHFPHSG